MTKFSAPQQNQLTQIGAYLRDNREKQGKSLEDIAIRTYIRPQLLNGIETGNPELLPEPIFVQGFIRRYAEALDINGRELSQQFTVDSIPSTPRPARRAAPEDSATTRLSRATSNQQPASTAPGNTAAPATAPMFSAGNLNTGIPAPANNPTNTPAVASTNPFKSNENADSPFIENDPVVANNAVKQLNNTVQAELHEPTVDSVRPAEEPLASASLDASLNDLGGDLGDDLGNDLEQNSTESNSTPQISLDQLDLGTPDQQAIDDVFASKIAAFDQQNLNDSAKQNSDNLSPGPLNLEGTSLNLGTPPTNNTVSSNTAFGDDLPPGLTTEASPLATPLTSSSATSVTPPATSRPPLPAGIEYSDTQNSPNLKPFIIGGIIVAALTAGMVIVASMLGDGDQQPNLAETPEPAEQVDETTTPATPVAEEPEIAAQPPISTAPVFVEATATSEAWVDIIADGNSIFEGTLQAGDTQVWEAQESLSIYSGDAGALKLAANGGESIVMGDRGQPAEKIFP